jgi:hypothetical protein
MTNGIKTILVVGNAPRSMGYKVVCKLLYAGYTVLAPRLYAHGVDEKLTASLSQMNINFLPGVTLVKENDNFSEIEYDPDNETKLNEIISGCYAVVYLSSVLYNYRFEKNSNLDGVVDNKALKQVATISRACGVARFICGFLPIEHRAEDDPMIAKDIRINSSDILIEFFPKITDNNFVVTMLQPCFLPSDKRRWRKGLNLTTITSQTINESKIRLFGGNKKQVCLIPKLQSHGEEGRREGYFCEFHAKSIIDICLFVLEYSDKVHKMNWLYGKGYQYALEHFYIGSKVVGFLKNPRVLFWGRLMTVARKVKRLFDASMMMSLLLVWPEQAYRFSTRKLLPNRSERFNVNDRPAIPFALIKAKTNKIQKVVKLNVVMRGVSFDISQLDELEGPIYLVNFNRPIETQKDVIYIEQSINHAYQMLQLGVSVCHVEVNRVAENGKTFPPDSYLDSNVYKKLLNDPSFTRIAIAENICRPFKLPLTSSWRPAGAGVNAICALSYIADKIDIYGWDFYFDSSPENMSSWEVFSNLYKVKLDIFRSRLHFECAIINCYYGYHLSRMPNINNYGYMGQLNRHKKLIKKIERVLFN